MELYEMEAYYICIVADPKEDEQTTKINNICMCCASETEYSIKINTCKHTEFLETCIELKADFEDAHICVICHNMLKKIALFKQQVEESIALLTDQAHILKINKIHNLQRTLPNIIDTTDLETNTSDLETNTSDLETNALDLEIKPEIDIEVPPIDSYVEVKLENDSSDLETEIPTTVIKKKKKRFNRLEKYEGKIREVMLSLEELREERESLAKQEKYLKLPYKCVHCIVAFDFEHTYKSHVEKKHKKTKNGIVCEICQSVMPSEQSYQSHCMRHKRRLECVECGKRYSHFPAVIQHYHEKHETDGSVPPQVFTCKFCGFDTTVYRKYRYHTEKHKDRKECSLCDKTFFSSSDLRTHMYTMHSQSSRIYSCTPCNKTFRGKSGLTVHNRTVHAQNTSAYCDTCNTYYKSEFALLRHQRHHTIHLEQRDKRFICDECGSTFLRKSSLQVHISWEHLKLRTYTCTKCSKVFKDAPGLARHVKYVHLKIRPPRSHICQYCGMAFTSLGILRNHLRRHTGERPLQCKYCNATFAQTGSLYTHIKLKHKQRK